MMRDSEIIRQYIFDTLLAQYDKTFAQEGLEHLIAVGQIAALLAFSKEIDSQLALIAGYLHDIAFYTTHYHPVHAKKSAQMALDILKAKTSLADDEIQKIVHAIACHSDKENIDDDFCEILKDADVISHTIQDGMKGMKPAEKERIQKYL